ncbi:squamosa promoter-binding 7 isoform X2, partial [Olea europaea subsp. europaea]
WLGVGGGWWCIGGVGGCRMSHGLSCSYGWEFGLVWYGGQAVGEVVVPVDMDDNLNLAFNLQAIYGPNVDPIQPQSQQPSNSTRVGKKCVRTTRNPVATMARCQVSECEIDISELKGYRRRHWICLRCANVIVVIK